MDGEEGEGNSVNEDELESANANGGVGSSGGKVDLLAPRVVIPKPFNNSIVDLRIVNNRIGRQCSFALESLFASNKTLNR